MHLGQWAILEDLDIHERFASGRYLNADETSSLAAALGVIMISLRRNQQLPQGGVILSSADTVSNATKRRRLSAASDDLDLVARTHQAHTSHSEQAKRSKRRQEMLSALRAPLPRVRSSRSAGVPFVLKVVARAVHELGVRLGISGLHNMLR